MRKNKNKCRYGISEEHSSLCARLNRYALAVELSREIFSCVRYFSCLKKSLKTTKPDTTACARRNATRIYLKKWKSYTRLVHLITCACLTTTRARSSRATTPIIAAYRERLVERWNTTQRASPLKTPAQSCPGSNNNFLVEFYFLSIWNLTDKICVKQNGFRVEAWALRRISPGISWLLRKLKLEYPSRKIDRAVLQRIE